MLALMAAPPRLHRPILAGMAIGLLLGFAARYGAPPEAVAWTVANVAQPLGQLFLRLVFMAVVPLVVAALALGVAEVGDVGKVGKVGAKTLLFTLVFSGLAVGLGLLAVNLLKPGVGLDPAAVASLKAAVGADAAKHVQAAQAAKPWHEALLELIPRNPFAEAVRAFEGGLLPLMTFALALGLGMSSVGEEKAAPLKAVLESTYAVVLRIVGFAMRFAPLGVGGLMFALGATVGLQALLVLAKFVGVVLLALAIQQFVVYGLAVKLVAGRSPIAYFRDLREAMFTAFATSSSAATLPVALLTATQKLKLPKPEATFVLTIGATANQNGTALYEGVTVLFLAQLFGVDLSLGQQLMVVLMSVLAGVGTAGVPGGSLPMIVIVLQSVGVPGAAIGIILGVDRVLDMARTVLNVSGDLTIATCVATGSEQPPSDAPPALQEQPA